MPLIPTSQETRARPSAVLAVVTALAWLLAPPAAPADEAALQAAYDAVLADPGDVRLTMEYARVATEAGDYEAAVGALERVLLISPQQHRVRANLGLLYHRLESYAAARHHLERALGSGALPPELADRVEDVLERGDRAMSRHRFDGRVSFGLRYRDNANAGPRSSTVISRGFTVALDEEFQEESDGDFFIIGGATHLYDLQHQSRTVIETNGSFYMNRQFDVDDIDNITAEVRTGPRFRLSAADAPPLTLRPHLVLNIVARGDKLFSNVYGGGLDFRYAPMPLLVTGATFQHRQREYHDSDERPTVDERDGYENHLSVFARYAFTPRVRALGRTTVIDRHAKAEFQDAVEVGVLGRIDFHYRSFFGTGRYAPDWRAYVLGSYRHLDFDAPNPRVSPTVSREDDEWRVGVGNTMPIDRWWSANVEASYAEADSNISNFERNNLSVAISATRRF